MAREHAFPSVRDWGKCFERHRETFDGNASPFLESLLTNAEWLFSELNMSAGEGILLHGDLHHKNILSAERQSWSAIDPKGLIGEVAYEAGAWLRNPVPAIQSGGVSKNILERRVDQFVDELTLERARIIGWVQSQAVLAACWALEDADVNWKLFLGWAELLSELD